MTGANKGIGFEICRQLASKGVAVVLTSRDEMRGREALRKLKEESSPDLPGEVIFHQLDVTDSKSTDALAAFIEAQFGKLDILVYICAADQNLSVRNGFVYRRKDGKDQHLTVPGAGEQCRRWRMHHRC